MKTGRLEKLLPLAGVAFSIVFFVGFAATGDTPEQNASAEAIGKYYDDGGKVLLGILAVSLCAILFMFFATAMRKHVVANGLEWLGTLGFAGGAIFVVGLTQFASSQFALFEAADDKNLQVLQSLNYIDNSNFPTATIGLSVFFLATAWHVLSTKSLPVWIGWVSLLLGVMGLAGPLGFIAFLAIMPWTLIVSILLYRRGRVPATVAA